MLNVNSKIPDTAKSVAVLPSNKLVTLELASAVLLLAGVICAVDTWVPVVSYILNSDRRNSSLPYYSHPEVVISHGKYSLAMAVKR